jgi:type II secretory pathway component PulM
MKEWFENLQPRERAIFIGGGVAAVLIVMWMAVLRPLETRSEVLREAVAAKQRLLVNLSQIDGQDVAAGPAGAEGQDQTIMRLVANSATEHGVALTRQRPDGPNGIQVTFGNASFDTLVAWLVALESQYSVSVESASFTGSRQPGIVNGQLLLRR